MTDQLAFFRSNLLYAVAPPGGTRLAHATANSGLPAHGLAIVDMTFVQISFQMLQSSKIYILPTRQCIGRSNRGGDPRTPLWKIKKSSWERTVSNFL